MTIENVLTYIILLIILISGVYVISNLVTNYLSLESADPTVYIENGVSGTVNITDPYLNETESININYYSLDSGSGAIVSKNGYIVTAFHLIGDPQAINNNNTLVKMDAGNIDPYLEQAAVSEYLSDYNSNLGSELINNGTVVNLSSPKYKSINPTIGSDNLIHVTSDEQDIKVYLRTPSQ